MAFLVYLFVLLVAAGSVIFGLDWTQAPLNPPPYAAPPAQSAAVNPAPPSAARTKVAPAAVARPQQTTVASAGDAAANRDEATQAQALATTVEKADQPDTTAAAARCNIAACSASYRSFRASDCTYQPYGGERRICTKTATGGRLATAAHPRGTARRNEYRGEPRLSDRRDYEGRGGGWGFDVFGGNAYDDGR